MKAANTQFKQEFKKMNIDEIEDTVRALCFTLFVLFTTVVHLSDCYFLWLHA